MLLTKTIPQTKQQQQQQHKKTQTRQARQGNTMQVYVKQLMAMNKHKF